MILPELNILKFYILIFLFQRDIVNDLFPGIILPGKDYTELMD